jgi:hypothetical protein
MGFVVTGIDDGNAVSLKPVAQGKRRVVEVLGADVDVANLEAALHEIMVPHMGIELLECDGKIRVLHLPCECFTQGLHKTPRGIDIPLVARYKKWGKEGYALYVVPMRMADEEMATQRLLAG